MEQIIATRLALLAGGYSLIPLEGKIPRMERWQTHFQTNRDEIELWAKAYPYAKNTGVLTRNMPTIDLDIFDRDAVEAIRQLAYQHFEERGVILTRVGHNPKCAIPLRTDVPFPKMMRTLTPPNGSTAKIEILGDGQQVVVDGIHPDTGKPYFWHGGNLLEIKWKDLPAVTKAEVEAFLDAAAALLAADFGYQPAADRPKRDATGGLEGSPEDWAYLIGNIINGRELHDSTVIVAAKLIGNGMRQRPAVDFIRAIYQRCEVKDQRWRERYDDISRAVATAGDKFEVREEPTPTASVWHDYSSWDQADPPAQEWSVPDLIPAKEVCLFSGTGGGGKSTIALHLCAAHALGLPWLNWMPKTGPTFFIDCEDHINVLWRRLAAVIRHYGKSFADLINGGLHILSLHGQENTLFATAARNGTIVPAPLYQWVLEQAWAIKPVQIVLASSANIYAGSEIDRSQVTQFTGLLARLAVASGGSVILISHPSLTGMSNQSGISGSTGWHNTVRARMYLEGKKNGKDAEDEQPTTDVRSLSFLKNQYGEAAAQITLRYRSGMFLPDPKLTDYELAARIATVENGFIAALRQLLASGCRLSQAPKRTNYAPRVIVDTPEAKAIKATEKELAQAMNAMLLSGKIKVVGYGKPSRGWTCIEPG